MPIIAGTEEDINAYLRVDKIKKLIRVGVGYIILMVLGVSFGGILWFIITLVIGGLLAGIIGIKIWREKTLVGTDRGFILK